MENPCTILCFGDSITKGYVPAFTQEIKKAYPDVQMTVINAGVSGETSRDGLIRLDQFVDKAPQVVVIGFGMNDWRKGISKPAFKQNICHMIDRFEEAGTRVLLITINPAAEGLRRGTNSEVDEYSAIIRELAIEKRVKIADVNALWKKKIRPATRGLRDALHPNALGQQIICEALMHVVPRRNTTVLWQYNSREAVCNYRCPYCYYIGLHHPDDMFFGTIEQWHEGFKRSFGRQPLVFYLAFGEPVLGKKFYDVVEMIGSEPHWELRMTSNVSQPMEQLMNTRIAREGRLHINASFHPLAVTRDEFLNSIHFLRKHAITVPIIYVMYPPFLKRFEEDIVLFQKQQFVVHVRRFQGWYKGKEYPYAYTDEEKRYIAKYSDDGMIKYMLNEQESKGKLTYSGLHFFVVDNVGNVGYDSNVFRPYTKYRCIFGNILQGNFRPLLAPGPYPGYREGTVDGVANLVEAGYHELEGNNVLSFARQGGVYSTDDTVFYKHLHTDFTDSRIRAEYNFPPRNVQDAYYLLTHSSGRRAVMLKHLAASYLPPGINPAVQVRRLRRKLSQIKRISVQ